jgi:hypothetical protein
VCGCGVPDADGDGDGVIDCVDNCPGTSNPGQEDWDIDGIGAACDPTEDADISTSVSCTGGSPWVATLTLTNNGPSTATGLSGGASIQVSCSCTFAQSGWPFGTTFAVGQSGYRYFTCTGSCWVSAGVSGLNNPDPNGSNDDVSVFCP